jgi:hypothetical protein
MEAILARSDERKNGNSVAPANEDDAVSLVTVADSNGVQDFISMS